MYLSARPVIFILALFSLLSFTSQSCSETFSQMVEKKNITHCKKLTLGAEFGWKYDPQNESRIEIFLGTRHHPELRWLAWGVNPGPRPQMVGTRALISIKHSNDSLVSDTYNITVDNKLGCILQPSKIELEVQNMKFEYMDATGFFTLYATLILPPNLYNISKLNHVWQIGYYAKGMEPKMHATTLQNVDSKETLNLKTGASMQGVGLHRNHLRVMHGILNIVGWGTLLPFGVIIARYFKRYPRKLKSWYVLHVTCQIVGYSIGTAGFAIGLWLGQASEYYSFHNHRILSIIIFTFTTLQIFALRLRPKATDEYRKYWNMYHHFLGYALLAVISVNIFKGIDILKADKTWKRAYMGVVVILAFIFMFFEVYTWTKFWTAKEPEDKKNKSSTTPVPVQASPPPGAGQPSPTPDAAGPY